MLLHGLKQEEYTPVLQSQAQQQSQPQQAIVQPNEQPSRKRGREDDGRMYDSHKDDVNKGVAWQLTALEQPVRITPPEQQPAYIYAPAPSKHDEIARLPSIKHLQLDPGRSWDYTTGHQHTPTHPPVNHPSTAYPPFPSQLQKSPLKTTQTITRPPSPPSQATELVQVKTNNNFGFIETTFANVHAKKAHRRRPAHVDKGSLYCHTCGSKNTPEWRRGPAGPATLCNACGLAYAKRLRQEEESQVAARERLAEQQQQAQQQQAHPILTPHPSSSPPPSPLLSQFAQYPTLALSDLYQQSGLFPPYDALPQHPSFPLPSSPSRPPSMFRSAQNRPNGHTFHQYTPPAGTSRTSSYPSSSYPPPPSSSSSSYPSSSYSHSPSPSSGAQVPVTTTTTTTTTTLYPFTLSPSEIPIIPSSLSQEPHSISPPPSNSSLNTLPVLTTLSTSGSDDPPNPPSSSPPRFSTLSYRATPNLPPAPSYTCGYSLSPFPSFPFTPYASSLSSACTPSTPSTASSTPATYIASPSPSPSSTPSSSSRSPTLTPITTIAALSNASPPSL